MRETTGGPKRFYRQAAAALRPDGRYTVELDGKPIRAPGGSAFLAPRAVAEAAAAEWAAQGERIAPQTMPVTRAVNTSLELVPVKRAEIVEEIAGYGGSDLVCYRAASPSELAALEAAAWDPLVAWAAERYGARLRLAEGVVHVAQPAEALARLRAAVGAESDLGLTALAELTALSGSLVLALAVVEGRLAPEAAWTASRIDEEYQIALWGRDAEADRLAAAKRADFLAAARLRALLDLDP